MPSALFFKSGVIQNLCPSGGLFFLFSTVIRISAFKNIFSDSLWAIGQVEMWIYVQCLNNVSFYRDVLEVIYQPSLREI